MAEKGEQVKKATALRNGLPRPKMVPPPITGSQLLEVVALKRYKEMLQTGVLKSRLQVGRCPPVALGNCDEGKLTIPPDPLSDGFFEGIADRFSDSGKVLGCRSGFMTTGNVHVEMSKSHFEKLAKRDAWWNNHVIANFCDAAQDRFNRMAPHLATQRRFKEPLLIWRVKGAVMAPSWSSPLDGLPFPTLGRDKSWRSTITVGVISASYQTHFIALAIFGPDRLVIPIDSSAGRWDCNDLKTVSDNGAC